MAKPIQILEEKANRFVINTNELFSILDSVSDKRIAVVSINGNKRTGKSFMLNYFLRYMYAKEVESGNWVYGDCSEALKGFDWRGGPERHTVGIWMWSEPFVITAKDGSEFALLLLDTQGNFDEKTTLNECAIIFALSAFLSSTMIFNMTKDISEDKLQFVEFFTSFAESLSGETDLTEKLFQRIVFLVRDWENECWYPYGCHDDHTPQTFNYKKDMIDPNENQCEEAQNTRKQVLSYFNDVKCFLLPHPGKKVSKLDFNGQTEMIDDEFIDYLKLFVPLIVDGSNVEAKKVFGEYVTGNSLKAYLTKWSDIIDTQEFPEVKTLATATAEVNQMMAFKEAMSLYETKISEYFEMRPNDEEFNENHKMIEAESIDYFMNKPKGHISEEKKSELINFLSARINQIFEVYRSSNLSRIEREITENNLNDALESHRDLHERLLDLQEQTEVTLVEANLKFSRNFCVKYKKVLLTLSSLIILLIYGSITTMNMNKFQNSLKNLELNQVPIGFIYFQLPFQSKPSQIWNKVIWQEVTANYSGMFFRAAGNSSAPFGTAQQDNCPRLTKVFRGDAGCTDGSVDTPAGGDSNSIRVSATGFIQNVNWCLRFTESGGEVRPMNHAIRIWKRIS